MKEKLISFRKKKERMDTQETEQPFTVIKKKKKKYGKELHPVTFPGNSPSTSRAF